jgi:hypothetical protein
MKSNQQRKLGAIGYYHKTKEQILHLANNGTPDQKKQADEFIYQYDKAQYQNGTMNNSFIAKQLEIQHLKDQRKT